MIKHNITEAQLEKDIKESHNFIKSYLKGENFESKKSNYEIFPPQLFGNENSEYLEYMNRIGESLFAIACSFDGIFDFIGAGTKDVTAIDINSKQYYVGCLKEWSINSLSFDEYKEFLIDFSAYKNFQEFIFKRISENVSDNDYAKIYWKSIFQAYKGNDILKGLFINGHLLNSNVHFGLRYKYTSNFIDYYNTKNKMQKANINFIHCDTREIDKLNLNKNSFDNISLSNISDFIDNQEYLNLLFNKIMPLLKENGRVMCSYLIQISSKNIEKLKQSIFNGNFSDKIDLLIKKQIELIEILLTYNPSWKSFLSGDGRQLGHYEDSALILGKRNI